jgi:hypothetical protein
MIRFDVYKQTVQLVIFLHTFNISYMCPKMRKLFFFCPFGQLRLSALFDLYIHPLKRILHPSHHKIYGFPALIHSLYHTLSTMGPLVTLSKYIHVTSCFEVFIETNLMVQSEFNLVFWLMSYNIFFS